jgi:hypothetical protein
MSGEEYLCRMEWVERNISAGWNEWRGISVQDGMSGDEYLCRIE